MNPSRQWFVCLQDEVIGPLSESAIFTLIRNQRLGAGDFGWREGLSGWVRLSEAPELTSFFGKTPRVLPPFKQPGASKAEAKPATVAKSEPTGTSPVRPNRAQRAPLEGWVRLDNGDLHRVINISETGVLVSIPHNVPIIGKEVKFRLESPAFGKPLELTGVLVREDFSTQENAVGIEFTRLNPAYRRMIKEYVQINEHKKAA